MLILAFETSCDDTSIALFRDDTLLVMETASQIKIHQLTHGVVPEVAAREHANSIFDVLTTVLTKSNISLQEIDFIAVTTHPGLMPSLLTGVTVASTLSSLLQIPLLPIHHIQAHIFSNFLERKEQEIEFPLVCLTVSGGHTEIYHMTNKWDFKKVGGTIDDSAGEAYDKVAKMMNLGYPGGPIISTLASEFIPPSIPPYKGGKQLFPRIWLDKKELNFSFSGLKTAVKYEIEKRMTNYEGRITKDKRITNYEGRITKYERQIGDSKYGESNAKKETENIFLSELDKKEIAYEFQNAVNEVLSYKLVFAGETFGVRSLMLAGGVSANDDLKQKIQTLASQKKVHFFSPTKKIYSMDNAAMIGILAYYQIKSGKFNPKNYSCSL